MNNCDGHSVYFILDEYNKVKQTIDPNADAN